MENIQNNSDITEVTEYEVIKACCGENENGRPKVSLTTAIVEYHGDINNSEGFKEDYNYSTLATRTIHNGILNLEIRDGIAQLDIRFRSYLDPELRLLWDLLETYGQRRFEAQNNPNARSMPYIIFEGLPEEFSDKYLLFFTNPMLWFLQPVSPEDSQLSVIRLFFTDSSFEIQDISEIVDVTQTEAEAMRMYDTIYTEN